jgi:6-phosphogluconolactonase (cycloisomerase 2 family)
MSRVLIIDEIPGDGSRMLSVRRFVLNVRLQLGYASCRAGDGHDRMTRTYPVPKGIRTVAWLEGPPPGYPITADKGAAMRTRSLKWTGAILAGLLAGATGAIPGVASAATSPVVGHVYLNDNTSGTNTIAAFDRHSDGTLSPVAGSPFAAGGRGTGAGLASQGALQLSGDGRYLLAVDAASNQVSVLRIKADGGLKLLPGGVVPSGGVRPVSVAVHDDLVYVANAGTGGSNYTGFTFNSGGHLRPLAGSTVSLPDGSQPGDVLFNATGTALVGTRVGTSQIDSFSVGANGLLTAAASSPIPAQALGPFGSEFRPTDPNQLFVTNAHDVQGSVSAFSVSADATLSSIGSSPFTNGQLGTCWVEISHNGQFLFAVNTGSGTISRYSINTDGSLALLGNTPVSATGGVGAVDARLSPDGGTLFVDESRIGAVASFAVNGGNLAELPSSPTSLPVGATPAGLVAN